VDKREWTNYRRRMVANSTFVSTLNPGNWSTNTWTTLFVVGLVALHSFPAWATRPPGYAKTEEIVPKTTTALVVEVKSCASTTEPGYHVMEFTLSPGEKLWGGNYTNDFRVAYKEFVVGDVPKGMSVCYANYTGSGIEFQAKPKEKYVCFLSEEKGKISLLRLEPIESKENVLKAYEELGKKTSGKPDAVNR
jgi:hypothetical protein